jgi:hypothetical protein
LLLLIIGALTMARGPREVIQELRRARLPADQRYDDPAVSDVWVLRFALALVFLGIILLLVSTGR